MRRGPRLAVGWAGPLRRGGACEARRGDRGHGRIGVGGDGPRGISVRREDRRGSYSVFIGIIVASMLFLGGLAHDGPRLIAARQHTAHAASEAARIAAATIASGATLEQAHRVADNRLGATDLIYGEEVRVAYVDCVGSRVQVTVLSSYVYRSAMRIVRQRQMIVAVAAAEAGLVLPGGQPAPLHYLGECVLA